MKCEFDEFLSQMAKKSTFEETLQADCGLNNRAIFSPKVSKEA